MLKSISKYNKSIITITICSLLTLTGCQYSASFIDTPEQETTTIKSNYIALDDFFDKSALSNVQISPDGNWLAFLKKTKNVNNLFLVKKGEGISEAIALTTLTDAIDNFWWSNNSGEIIFSKDNQGNENQQIFKLNFNPTDFTQAINIIKLTHNDNVNYMFGDQPSELTNTILLLANHDDQKRLDFYHLNTNTKKLKIVEKNTLNFQSFFSNKAGEVIIGNTLNSDNTSSLYTKKNNVWTKLLSAEAGETFNVLYADTNSNTAYISADIQGRDKKELLLLNMTTGKVETYHKDPKGESDLKNVVFDKQGNPLIASYYGGRLRNYPLNKNVQQRFDKIHAHFSDDIDMTVNKIDQDQWSISVDYSKQQTQNFIYDIKKDTYIDLLNKSPKVSPELLGERKSIYYKAKDGVTIQAYLTLPKTVKRNLPTIILPHGGPWSRDTWSYSGGYFNSIALFFADRGYAVLQPNFRGSLGFGKKFTQLGERNWGTGTMQQDLTDGVNYLVSTGVADKERVGIMGASYGGYAALSGATFTPDVYNAVISYVGPSSLITLMESFPDYYRPYLGTWFTSVGDPKIKEDRKDMHSRSPINFVDKIKAPLMLIQGANDPRVTQAESDNIAREMYKNSKVVEYILAKNEGHGFRNHDNKVASIMAMEVFFAKHLGGIDASEINKEAKDHLRTLKVDVSKL